MQPTLLRLRPLAAMISVVRAQRCVDGTCLHCEVWVAIVQLDEGEPLDIREARTLLPCAADLTDEERAAALRELRHDLRSRAASDPRYATRHVPEAA